MTEGLLYKYNLEEWRGRMKKIVRFVFILAIGVFSVVGCGSAEPDSEMSVFMITDDITNVNVEHYVGGEITQWIAEGAEVDKLRNWFNGLEYTLFEYEEGKNPGDGEGGEFYSFTFAEEDISGFSYVINGSEDCYLLMEGCWYLVKNPLQPPISNE